MPSVSNWLIKRRRVLPRAKRIAISRRRDVALASIMLARFKHAISRTIPAMAERTTEANVTSD